MAHTLHMVGTFLKFSARCEDANGASTVTTKYFVLSRVILNPQQQVFAQCDAVGAVLTIITPWRFHYGHGVALEFLREADSLEKRLVTIEIQVLKASGCFQDCHTHISLFPGLP